MLHVGASSIPYEHILHVPTRIFQWNDLFESEKKDLTSKNRDCDIPLESWILFDDVKGIEHVTGARIPLTSSKSILDLLKLSSGFSILRAS
jgi:hypothetical protein